MKSLLSVIAVAALCAGLSSCKKDYTCNCTSENDFGSSTSSATAELSKKDAEEWCEGYNSSTTTLGITTTTTCTLE